MSLQLGKATDQILVKESEVEVWHGTSRNSWKESSQIGSVSFFPFFSPSFLTVDLTLQLQ